MFKLFKQVGNLVHFSYYKSILFVFVFLISNMVYGTDLSIDDLLIIKPENPSVNDWVKISAVVKNNGSDNVTGVSVDLFKNAEGNLEGQTGDLSYILRELPANKSIKIDYVFKVKGNLNVRVFIDPSNQLKEGNRTNNISALLSVPVNPTENVDDNMEPNNTINSNFILANGTHGGLISRDDDYFKLNASTGDTIFVKLYNYEFDTSNLKLYLYDPSNHLVQAVESRENIKLLTYKVTGASGKYTLLVKSGLNKTGYLLDTNVGKAADISVSVSLVDLKTEIVNPGDTGIFYVSENILQAPVYEIINSVKDTNSLKVNYEYVVNLKVTVENTGEPIDGEEYFYIDIFRNRTYKPVLGEYGNVTYIKVKGSDLIANKGSFVVNVPVNKTYADEKLVAGHYTYFAVADTDGRLLESNLSNNITGPLNVLVDHKNAYRCTSCSMTYNGDTFVSFQAFAFYHPKSLVDSIEQYIINTNGAKLKDDYYDHNTYENPSNGYDNDYHPQTLNGDSAYKNFIKITPGRYTNLYAWDDDYYLVDLGPGETLESSINYQNIYGNLDLALYPVDSNSLLRISDSGNNWEAISYKNNSSVPKSYVLRVIPRQVNPQYSLSVETFAGNPNRDLEITYLDIKQKNSSTLTVNLKYRNVGTETIQSCGIAFYKKNTNTLPTNNDLVYSQEIYGDDVTKGIEPDNVYSLQFDVSSGGGQEYYFAEIDSGHNHAELNEDNNMIMVQGTNLGVRTDDYLETSGQADNDSLLHATVVKTGNYENLYALDQDWYKLTVAPGKKINMSLLYNSRFGDLSLSVNLLDHVNPDTGEAVYTQPYFSDNTGDDEYIEYTNTTSGPVDIYLLVDPNSNPANSSSNLYSLHIEESVVIGYKDLAIKTLVSSPVSGFEGDTFRSTVEIVNQGNEDISPTQKVFVDLFVNKSGAAAPGDFSHFYTVFKDGIPAGGTVYTTFEYTLSRGSYVVSAVVDTENRIRESIESNNTFTGNPVTASLQSASDITGQITSVTSKANGDIEVKANVSNIGDMQVTSADYLVLLRAADGPDAGIVAHSEVQSDSNVLNAGNTVELIFTIPHDEFVPEGNYYAEVIIDPGRKLVEKSKDNNLMSLPASTVHITNASRVVVIETFRQLTYDGFDADTVIELYKVDPTDTTGATLIPVSSNDNYLDQFSKIRAALSPGNYFLRIRGFRGNTGNYNVFIGYDPLTGVTPISVRDPSLYEQNNDRAHANNYDIDNPVIFKQKIDTFSDEDWIRFTVR